MGDLHAKQVERESRVPVKRSGHGTHALWKTYQPWNWSSQPNSVIDSIMPNRPIDGRVEDLA